MASVRFICGTQEEHKQLEARISAFLGLEDTILYGSCFDANGGLFETLLGEEDAIISDALNHASIIDGVRLSKAKRFRYANNDMAALEEELKKAEGSRFKLIATDGVFSMDGIIANLAASATSPKNTARWSWSTTAMPSASSAGMAAARPSIAASRAGSTSSPARWARRSAARRAATRGKREVVDWLRQRSRPYLFSNTLMPAIAAASLKVFDIVERATRCAQSLSPTPRASARR
jgi:glycine C-acetyltransferase